MIVSVDFNPILKRKYTFDRIDRKGVNIPLKTQYGAGGDGIEMAYLLNALNEEVKVSGCIGGINGSYIQDNLSQLKIPNSFVPIKDDSPELIMLSSKNGETLISSREARITREELNAFYKIYNSLVMQANLICFLGKIPATMPKEIIYDFIEVAKKYNRKILIRLSGEELRYSLDSEPFLLLIDRKDLEDITKLRLRTTGEIIRASRYIMDRGVKHLAINLEERGSLLISQDRYYRLSIENQGKNFKTNPAYMLAGYALALNRSYDIEMAAKLGQACGICNSYIEEDIKDMGDIKYIMNEIEVKEYDY